MKPFVLTPPASEPVTLAEAKAQIRLEIPDDDLQVMRKLQAARERCEAEIARSFVTTGWRMKLDGFPSWGDISGAYDSRRWLERGGTVGYLLPIEIPRADLIAVSSITYINNLGVSTVLAPSQYVVSTGAPGCIYPAYGTRWPTPRTQADAVTVDFTVGYGTAANVPACIKEAILMLMGHLYENREATTELNLKDLPFGVIALLAVEGWGQYA